MEKVPEGEGSIPKGKRKLCHSELEEKSEKEKASVKKRDLKKK